MVRAKSLFAKNRRGRGAINLGQRNRLARFEELESRQLLSITLPTISAQTLLSGAGLNLVLDGTSSDGNALTYSVSVANANLTGGASLYADVAEGNPSLKLSVLAENGDLSGNLVFQLFEDLAPETVDNIMALVESGYYDGLTFHRIIEDFMIQGGDPNGDGSGGPDARFDDEFNVLLQFTSPGLLAMANSGDDTNGSQFFITTDKTRWLDFNYNIFGILTEGYNLLDQLDSVATDDSDAPINDVVISDASIVADTQTGVLRLFAANGATGTASVTVTATDSVTGETASRTFAVTVNADTTNDPPFLADIDPIVTTADVAVTFNIPGVDVEGDAMKYAAALVTDTEYVTLAVDENTGEVTITPSAGACGVVIIEVGVSNSAGTNMDTQYIPVCITPYAPTGVTLVSDFDTGTSNSDRLTNLNNGAGAAMQFTVTGVTSGMTVGIYADGVLIGSTVATATTATVTTNGAAALADGAHTITATQTLENQTINCNNLQSVADLESPKTTTMALTVASADPVFDFTPAATAVVGVDYGCQADVAESSVDGLTYAYSLIGAPAGMTIESTTGLITWTPSASQAATTAIVVKVADSAGNEAQTTYSLTVLAENAAPVLVAAAPSLGTTDEDTAIVVNVSDFINNGDGTTAITDNDLNAVVGGIALVGLTGDGVWTYSLNGETFAPVGTVAESAALLLPTDAVLRYAPTGAGGETATIVYRAWDTTGGIEGTKVNLSGNGATGGASAYSAASDTAALTVTASNDAPVLTAAAPSLGVTDVETAVTIALAAFINNGDGTTSVTDPDGDALGGIALVQLTGDGVWAYSLDDGATFIDISAGSVSQASALLLSADALLRYTPDGATAETAAITYLAWDATEGTAGQSADASSTGGASVFSAASDTASLAVNSLVVNTCSISGYVYVDADNDGLRITSTGQSHRAIQGVTVTLYVKETDSSWMQVAAASTGATGAYGFTGLAAGTYKVVENQPTRYIDGLDTLGTVGGAKTGTAGNDQHVVTLAEDEAGVEYNFGERGLKCGYISLRSTLASARSASSSSGGTSTNGSTQTDSTGNSEPAATLDSVAPAGYTVAFVGGSYDADAASSIGFTLSNAEAFTTYNYTIASDGGTETVAKTGTLTLESFIFTGIDVSSLADGTLTLSFTLTDAAGNTGETATAFATLGRSTVAADAALSETEEWL